MSTEDKDDRDIYIIIQKLDVDGNHLLSLNIPLGRQPFGTTFDEVDNFNLYKLIPTPAGLLRASKRGRG